MGTADGDDPGGVSRRPSRAYSLALDGARARCEGWAFLRARDHERGLSVHVRRQVLVADVCRQATAGPSMRILTRVAAPTRQPTTASTYDLVCSLIILARSSAPSSPPGPGAGLCAGRPGMEPSKGKDVGPGGQVRRGGADALVHLYSTLSRAHHAERHRIACAPVRQGNE